MSIFKDSFDINIQEQLKTRQKAINNRTADNLTYYNSRNSWIRLSSSVNTYKGSGDINNITSYTPDLSKKYILQGGILNNNQQRSGLGDFSNAYSNKGSEGIPYRLGIKPMPGITSVDIKSLGAYGSLREATVNFQCWDIQQLEDLELLYMRPGYSVLLEWGWAPYLKNGTSGNEYNDGKLNSLIEYEDIIDKKWTKEELFARQYTRSTDVYQGNVDSMFGMIKNYSWKARPDGGYDCTTTIISLGEVIESLKVNYAPLDNISNISLNGLLYNNIQETGNKPSSLSENYTKNIIAGLCDELWNIGKNKSNGGEGEGVDVSLFDSKFNTEYSLFVKKININGDGEGAAKSTGKVGNSDVQVYIQLEGFLNILNNYVLLRDNKSNKPFTSLSVRERKANKFDLNTGEGYLLSLAHPLEISVDLTTCIIKNNLWNNIRFKNPSPNDYIDPKTGTPVVSDFKENAEISKTLEEIKQSNKKISDSVENIGFLDKIKYPYFKNEKWEEELGVIANIYLNVNMLYNLSLNNGLESQDPKEKRDISLYDYMKNILTRVSSAIGEVNNFEIFIDPIDNVARIIDINYVDANPTQTYENAFVLEMHNLDSIVRSYSLESKIFPNQSTIVAIGAQTGGGALGIDTTTLVNFNKSIMDRIIPIKDAPTSNTNIDFLSQWNTLNVALSNLSKFLIGLDNSAFGFSDSDFDLNNTSDYRTSLKDLINYYKILNGSKTNNKAIIPTKLSITMDGIGGLIIGNVFRIPEDILPKGYKSNLDGSGVKIGYTITGIGHSIQNNDWVTKIEAQTITFDEPKINNQFSELIIPILENSGEITNVVTNKNRGGGSVDLYSEKYPVLVKTEEWKKEYNSAVQKYAKVSFNTPVADSLRKELKILGGFIVEKGSELSSNGDITNELKDTILVFAKKIKTTKGFEFINSSNPLIITAGNDIYHREYGIKRNQTTHGRGLAIDIRTSSWNSTQINSVKGLLYASGFAYVLYHGPVYHIHANISTK